MEMLAKIYGNNSQLVEVEITGDNGEVQRKVITFSDFVSGLTESNVQGDDYITIGALPQGYVNGKRSTTCDTTFKCLIRVPKGKKVFMYYDSTYVIPFPQLVFEIEVTCGAVTKSNCFALRDGEDLLSHYPFGNVFSEGRICWGSTQLPKINKMCELDQIVALFFGSVTNDDLYQAGATVAKTEETITQRGLITSLLNKDEFPQELLVHTKKTLKMLEQ